MAEPRKHGECKYQHLFLKPKHGLRLIDECSLIQNSIQWSFGGHLQIPVKKQTFGKASVYSLFEKRVLFRQAENSCFILYLLVFCVIMAKKFNIILLLL